MKPIPAKLSLASDIWIADNATICGAVTVGQYSNIWYGAVLRGDVSPIVLGEYCNIQDGAVIHGDAGEPTVLEDCVTVGHRAIIHSAHIERGCTIGMGAIVMNGVRIGTGSIVGAGAVVTKSVDSGTLVVGMPAKYRRNLATEELVKGIEHAKQYWEMAIAHRDGKYPLASS